MRVIALDHETSLIRPSFQCPPIVCGQYVEISAGGTLGAPSVELPETYLPRLVTWLREPDTLIVGAETSYEILTSCTTVDTTHRHMAGSLGLDPSCPGTSLIELWVAAIDADRVTDVLIRQKLIDLARGCYRYERNLDGRITGAHRYNLADLSKRIAGIDLGDTKKCRVCDNTGCPHCPWRLRYAELAGIDPKAWPPEAYQYAALDPYATAAVWIAQWKRSTKIEANFPGVTVQDVLREEFDEVRAALPLKAMSAYGLRTDPKAVRIFAEHVEEEYGAVADALVDRGLLRRDWIRNLGKIQEWLRREPTPTGVLADHFFSTVDVPTEDGSGVVGIPHWSFAKACFEAACVGASEVQQQILLLIYQKSWDHPHLLELGLSEVDETKDTKAAHQLVEWAHRSTGAACVPDALMTAGGKEKKLAPGEAPPATPKKLAPKVPKTDKDSLGIAADLLESALGAGRFDGPTGDLAAIAAETLRDYAEFGHLGKQLSTDIPILKLGATQPIHTRYETILETERTSSSGPNVQNQARGGKIKCRACRGKGKHADGGPCDRCGGKGKRDLPGTRECFVPRKGWVLVDADYSMLEIYALAQTCLWELGYSAMAEVLRAGKDVHLVVAAQILSITYEEALAIFQDDKHPRNGEVKNARNCAKAVNFGRPGGLSAKTMRSYAVKSYGVSRTVEEWQEIITTWNNTWSEMPAYFARVNSQESYPKSELFNIRYASPRTGARDLAGTPSGLDGFRALATYCAACNSKYQRLGAKVAKRALWYVFRACYTRTSDGSADMFGCRPVLFVHDQIFTEAPEAQGHRAALTQARLMNQAGREICPDASPKTEPILCLRWSKEAKEVRGSSGELVAWEDSRLTVVA